MIRPWEIGLCMAEKLKQIVTNCIWKTVYYDFTMVQNLFYKSATQN